MQSWDFWPCPAKTSHVERSECHAGLGSSAPPCLVHQHGGTGELCRAGIFGQCFPERLLFGSLERERWAMWLHCKEANPISPVSSASATPGKGTHASPPPTVLWAPPPTKDCSDQLCKVPDTHAVGRKESSSKKRHSKCQILGGYGLRLGQSA